MKYNLITAGLLVIVTLGSTACGKKAQDKSSVGQENAVEIIESESIEETHKELLTAILKNDLPKIKTILGTKKQVNLNLILTDGQTLLTTAVNQNQSQIVELLIENGASVHKTNSKKENSVMVASKLGLESMVRLLISLGGKTDSKDLNGNTALHLAILNNQEAIALYLINNKTNIDITNNDNQTALKLAQILNLTKVADLLRSLTQSSVGLPDKMTVRHLITLGDVENLKQLVVRYPSVLLEYSDLNYYVLVIRSHPHDKALSLTHMLHGYGISMAGPKKAEVTPLIEAIKQGDAYVDFVALMLEEQVDPNAKDDKGISPLMWAVRGNSLIMSRALYAKGAQKKYSWSNKTYSVCDEVRKVRTKLKTTEAKRTSDDILEALDCGLRWLL